MDPRMRTRWLLSGLFTALVLLATFWFEGGLRLIAVIAVAAVYFVVTRRGFPG